MTYTTEQKDYARKVMAATVAFATQILDKYSKEDLEAVSARLAPHMVAIATRLAGENPMVLLCPRQVENAFLWGFLLCQAVQDEVVVLPDLGPLPFGEEP